LHGQLAQPAAVLVIIATFAVLVEALVRSSPTTMMAMKLLSPARTVVEQVLTIPAPLALGLAVSSS